MHGHRNDPWWGCGLSSLSTRSNHVKGVLMLRRALPTTKIKVAFAAFAVLALSLGTVGTTVAVVIQGLSVSKGCDSPTAVGAPYSCLYVITNSSAANPSQNTLVITNVKDDISAKSGLVTSTVELTRGYFNTGAVNATCAGGTGTGTAGDPFVNSTSCSLPFNSTLQSVDTSFYTVANADYTLAGHVLADTATVTWHSL